MEEEKKEQVEQEKKPNPYWLKINKLEEVISKLAHKIELIEKSLRRTK